MMMVKGSYGFPLLGPHVFLWEVDEGWMLNGQASGGQMASCGTSRSRPPHCTPAWCLKRMTLVALISLSLISCPVRFSPWEQQPVFREVCKYFPWLSLCQAVVRPLRVSSSKGRNSCQSHPTAWSDFLLPYLLL